MSSKLPAEVLALIGHPALLESESEEDYYRLLKAMGDAAGAVDLIDWMLVDNACSCAWSLRQLRHARVDFLNSVVSEELIDDVENAHEETLSAIEDMIEEADEDIKPKLKKHLRLAREALDDDESPEKHFDEVRELMQVEFGTAKSFATSFAKMIVRDATKMEPIDRLIEKFEIRLERSLREIDRRHLNAVKIRLIARAAENSAGDKSE